MNVTLLLDLHLVLADTFMLHVSASLNESGKVGTLHPVKRCSFFFKSPCRSQTRGLTCHVCFCWPRHDDHCQERLFSKIVEFIQVFHCSQLSTCAIDNVYSDIAELDYQAHSSLSSQLLTLEIIASCQALIIVATFGSLYQWQPPLCWLASLWVET